MLRIGQRQYELVRAQSGFNAELFPPDPIKRTQAWWLDAYYVPAADTPPLEDGTLEHLQLTIRSEYYRLDDWRNLTGLELDNEDEDTWFGYANLENLLNEDRRQEILDIVPGCLKVTRLNGYLFHCEFDGTLQRADKIEEDLEFTDDLPFAEVSLGVPINAADPVKTALALAGRAIGLTEISGGRVTRHDWRLKAGRQGPLQDHHQVHLQTPWRNHLA